MATLNENFEKLVESLTPGNTKQVGMGDFLVYANEIFVVGIVRVNHRSYLSAVSIFGGSRIGEAVEIVLASDKVDISEISGVVSPNLIRVIKSPFPQGA